MKKVFALAISVAIVFSLAACANQNVATPTPQDTPPVQQASDAPQPQETDKEMTIVIIPKLVHEFYNYVLDGANQAVSELAATGQKINVIWSAPTSADVVEQTEKLEAAISLKPDYIAIAVIDGSSVKSLLDQAQAQGIKVIAFDTDYEGSNADAFIGASLEAQSQSGSQVADQLIKMSGKDSGKIAMLTGSPDAENHTLFSGGFRDRVKAEYPNFEIVTEQADNDDKGRATELTEAILAQYPDVDIIFGGNGSAGVGAAIAVEAAVSAGQIPKGQVFISNYCLMADPQASMEAGWLSCIIDYSPYYEGYYSVMAAAQEYFNGIPLQGIDIPFGIVTMENLDTYSAEYHQICIDNGAEYWK